MKLMSLMTSMAATFALVGLISAGCTERDPGEARQEVRETQQEATQDINEAQSSAVENVQEAKQEAREDVSEAQSEARQAEQQATESLQGTTSGTTTDRQPAAAGEQQVTPELCRQLAQERPVRPENQKLYDACAKANFDSQSK